MTATSLGQQMCEHPPVHNGDHHLASTGGHIVASVPHVVRDHNPISQHDLGYVIDPRRPKLLVIITVSAAQAFLRSCTCELSALRSLPGWCRSKSG